MYCLAIIGVSIFPLLISDIYYLDDSYRVVTGIIGWSGDARPVGEIFYKILTLSNNSLPDLFPAPLILSILFLCYVFSLLSTKFSNGHTFLFALCISPVILNPLFNANLHFRYDSPFMVLSIAFALLPYCFSFKNKIADYLIPALFVTLALSSYQVSVNIFITFALIELTYNITRGDIKKSVIILLGRVVIILLGYLLYSKIVINLITVNSYFHEYSRIISLDKTGVLKLFDNLISSFAIFSGGWNMGFRIFMLSLALISGISLIGLAIKNHKTIIGTSFLLVSWVVMLLTSILFIPGVMIFSENPLFLSRGYVGLGGFISAMMIPACWISFKHIRFLVAIVYIYIIGFSYASNNAIKLENSHIENTAIRIINDIESYDTTGQIKYVDIDGQLQKSESTNIAIRAYPLIKSILPKAFYYNYNIGQFIINRNGMPNIKYTNPDKHHAPEYCHSKKSRYYYDICFGDNETAYITFK